MPIPSFGAEVYRLVSSIPRGKVSTYKEVARAAGNPRAARAVGMVLHHNTDFERVPCHRVVHADGTVGGYVKGRKKKIALLTSEGVTIRKNAVDFSTCLYSFSRRKKISS